MNLHDAPHDAPHERAPHGPRAGTGGARLASAGCGCANIVLAPVLGLILAACALAWDILKTVWDAFPMWS